MKPSLFLLAALPLFGQADTQTGTQDIRWKSLHFLMGEWVAEGGGKPGEGKGEFSFRSELNGKVLVRRSYNQLPSARHEDLMVVYASDPQTPLRASYWDSEGHVIQYHLATGPKTAIFESDPAQPGPRYRLTYTANGTKLDGKFEVAPPGAEYKTYLTWTSRRK